MEKKPTDIVKTTYELSRATKQNIESIRDELKRRGFYGVTSSVIVELLLSTATIDSYIEMYKPVIKDYADQINEKGYYVGRDWPDQVRD